MKRFENEVLTFDTSTLKDIEPMSETLRTLGNKGWEVVSVVPRDVGSGEFIVFLKREITDDGLGREKAA